MRFQGFAFAAALLAGLICGRAEASSPLVLEHTFDGYYYPYNFPVVMESDDDRYFGEVVSTFNKETNEFSTRTYNEDYSVRSSIRVKLQSLPPDYTVSQVSYSPMFKLPDGTPIISVSGINGASSAGTQGYAKCWFFNASTGAMIALAASSTFQTTVPNTVFEINGKPSVVVQAYEYDSRTYQQSYKTYIYSLGNESGNRVVEQTPATVPFVVDITDASGKSIGTVRQEHPGVQIVRMSDGTARKTMAK